MLEGATASIEAGRVHQGVDALHPVPHGIRDHVEGGSRRRRDRHRIGELRFTGSQQIRVDDEAGGGRRLAWMSSIGVSPSNHFAPSIADAARPPTTPRRPDHSHAARARSATDARHRAAPTRRGTSRSGTCAVPDRQCVGIQRLGRAEGPWDRLHCRTVASASDDPDATPWSYPQARGAASVRIEGLTGELRTKPHGREKGRADGAPILAT